MEPGFSAFMLSVLPVFVPTRNLLGIASSGFPIPDFSGPEEKISESGNFKSRSGNREMAFLSFFDCLNYSNIEKGMRLKNNTPSLDPFA